MGWEISGADVALAALVFVVSLVATTAAVTAFLVMIPPDYFVHSRAPLSRRGSTATRVALIIGKNLLGVVLVVAGVVLSVPGVPGQGLLTILVGVLLLDIPGKRKLELRLVSRRAIRRTVDRVRRRFGKPPIEIELDAAGLAEPHPDNRDADPPTSAEPPSSNPP